jgi:hypothetical protein
MDTTTTSTVMTHPFGRHPTPEQHLGLLNDCWHLVHALPTSGVLDRGGRPYRALRVERKLQTVEDDPVGLLEYIRGMARRWSEGLDALVKYNRLDLSLETLILDESKVYAPLFTDEDRAAARAKLQRQESQVKDLKRDRERKLDDEDRAVIKIMNDRRIAEGRAVLTPDQETVVLERRRRTRAVDPTGGR